MTPKAESDPYSVLGVARTASDSEIRAAYHALVAKYHPDRYQGNPLEDLANEKLA
jgi:curved DNA-binding protein CbpA